MRERIEARAAKGEDLFEAAKAEVLAVDAQHAALDSPAEYRRNSTACNGRVLKLALNRQVNGKLR